CRSASAPRGRRRTAPRRGRAPSPPGSPPCGSEAPGPASSCRQNSSWVCPVLLELGLGPLIALCWSARGRWGLLARGRSHGGDARAGEMLQDLPDVGMVADALDLARFALAALHTQRCRALVSAQGHDPHPAGPGFELAHQVLAELFRRIGKRVEL